MQVNEASPRYLAHAGAQDLPEGYKRTDVGLIPEDWSVRFLGDEIDRLDAGVSVNSVDEELQVYAHEQAILKTSAVSGGHFLPHESKRIAPRDIRRAKLNPRKDTIIVSRMNTPQLVGECGYVDKDYPDLYLPDRLWMTHLRTDSKTNVKWLSYLLSHATYKSKLQSAATGTSGSMKNIAKDSFFRISIPFPAQAEQDAIAASLSDADGLLGALEAFIAKKRAIKQAAMQQLLTGLTRLPGFSGEWEEKQIGEFTDCTAGGTPSTLKAEYWGGAIRWMNSGEVNLKIVCEVEGRITEKGLRESSTKIVPPRCVLIGLAGQGKTRGTVAMNTVELCTNQSIAAVFPNESFVPEYLYYNLDSRYDELRGMSTGEGGRGGLNLKIIRSISVPFPSVNEQTAIATVLSDMDAEIAALEARRDKAHALKQGMMHQLLTGRVRLVGPRKKEATA